MADELASRVRIPFDLLKVGRELQKFVVPIKVSMENSWTLNSKIVKASLRQVVSYLLDFFLDIVFRALMFLMIAFIYQSHLSVAQILKWKPSS